MAYGLGLLPFIMIKVLAPGYYARQDTKTPVKIGIVAMVTNMALNVILMMQLAHIGLALATSLSALLNAGLLFAGLIKLGVYQPAPGWGRFTLRILIPNALLIGFLLYFTPASVSWYEHSVWERFGTLITLIVAAMMVYFSTLHLSGIKLKTLIKPIN
jgi:putative peptidoglycan lipid II flippase